MKQLPATEHDLRDFIGSAKDHGVADGFIAALLQRNGWSERRVFRAYSEYYGAILGTPVPSRSQYAENARDAFYYLINFLTLGFWTVALGQIWYVLIARWFPDAAAYDFSQLNLRDQISWQAATVIVAFPIFALVHYLIRKQLALRPDMYESGVRKWLTYIALVFAALVVLTDGVWFTNALLRGEITVRFILDSIVLLVLGGGVFTYYLATINPPETRA